MRYRKIFIPWNTLTKDPVQQTTSTGPTLFWLWETDGDCPVIRAQFNTVKQDLSALTAQSVSIRPDSTLGYQEVNCDGTPVDPGSDGSYILGPTDSLIESGDDGTEKPNDDLNPVT